MPDKTRVLLIDLGAGFGGVESYLVGLAQLIGNEVDLYALCVLPELKRRLSENGVRVIQLPLFPGYAKPLRFLAALIVLPFVLLIARIDSVQLNGFLESILIFPSRLLGRKAVYTRHGPFELQQYRWWREPLKYLPRATARWAVRFASHVVCVSQAVEESVKPILSPLRYSVISNWVTGREYPQAVRSDLQPQARILIASRLERYKGAYLALEALRNFPEPFELVIAGDGSYRQALEEMAEGSARVKFAGFQQDLEPLYQQADIFIMPSLGPEGLPMTSLEAMAHGIPCIFSDLPVHAEITDNGIGARLFKSGDAGSLRQALDELLKSAALRQQYSREAFRIVAGRYTERTAKSAYLKVFGGVACNV